MNLPKNQTVFQTKIRETEIQYDLSNGDIPRQIVQVLTYVLLMQPINSAHYISCNKTKPIQQKLMSLNPKQSDTFRFEKNFSVSVVSIKDQQYVLKIRYTVKLGFKELLNKEQIGNSEPFPVTNLPVYLMSSEQFCDGQKVP